MRLPPQITLVPNTELTRAKFAKFAKNFVFNIVGASVLLSPPPGVAAHTDG